MSLLKVRNLKTKFKTDSGEIIAVNGISFGVQNGEVLGLAGESGSGKTSSMLSVMGLLSENSAVTEGEVFFNGRNLRKLNNRQMQKIRGKEIGIIFQNPSTSLNPVFRTGSQLKEVIMKNNRISGKEAYKKAVEMLKKVSLPEPEKIIRRYPHTLSGGMKQRVMIAMALCQKPKLLIADEATTGLDVRVQAQILDLLSRLKREYEISIIFITHDLRLAANICDRVIVMYAGSIVEKGGINQILNNPLHPYTKALVECIPKIDMDDKPLKPIDGHPPDMTYIPCGCPFYERCGERMEICRLKKSGFKEIQKGHKVTCWRR